MDYIKQMIERYPMLSVCRDQVLAAYDILEKSYQSGCKLLVAGNGGSASDADHICGELLKSFVKKRTLEKSFIDKLSSIDKEAGAYLGIKLQGAFPALSLAAMAAINTAVLNDVDGNMIFAQTVNGLGKPGDVFLGITTSGNSKDIIYAAVVAKAKGLKTIALTGRDGGKIKDIVDVSIVVPEKETFMIQELHLPIYHALCLQLEDYFFPI